MTEFDTVSDLADSGAMRALDLSMFTSRDIMNVVLQRSEVLQDIPGYPEAIRAWVRGDDAPLMKIVKSMGHVLVRRAISFISLEYNELKPVLQKIAPKRLADIGCGYAFFDLFAHGDFGCDLVLIDTEENDKRHFKFRKNGAAYSSLETTRAFLVANGCPPDRVTTINPQRQDVTDERDIDMAVSFISCGFHYPCDMYRDFFDRSVRPGGSVILDLRMRLIDDIRPGLDGLGSMHQIGEAAGGKAMRMHLVTRPRSKSRAA